MTSQGVYQHFRPEEHDFIDKITRLAQRVEETYAYVLTEFLNPRQIEIAKTVVNHFGLKAFVSSDYYASEYARLIIAPEYYVCQVEDFELALLEVRYQSKFAQLSHAQIMGTLLNHLGIKRTVIGDILVTDGYAQVLVLRNMSDYIRIHTTKIARTSVSLREIPLSDIIVANQASLQLNVIVSSMRLDKILATVLKLSRTQAAQLIGTGKVKLNYQLIDKTATVLQVGDLVSVRGFGRFSILSDNGITKNGKLKLTIDKMIHK
ncbi:RNA-binding protein [uncultured Streptococcus sp.]|uniref:YlmH family RNA-binding protein n=1 Tax=uncultured Streptococcus sp. TaxID=83427 RepID=UPI0025F30BF0|nr:RNA-binding protein [uncultured Streptococcus sp.]